VFQNLIENAIKYSTAETPQVHISAAQEGDRWTISVSDNGIGIEPQHAQRVFELFQRLHTQDQLPGSGLGLAICKRVVERLGGRIWVEPRQPRGSVFRFTLPADPAPAATEPRR
jgi:signal transduction histidine kinase